MRNKKPLLGTILAIVALLIVVIMFIGSLKDCGRYARLYNDPIYVDAVVTDHDEYEDSDGDTTYRSYITYRLDGKKYTNVRYESTSSRSKLTDLGEEVTITINPEDHGELMKDVANPATTVMLGVFTSLGMAAAIQELLRLKLSRYQLGAIDREVARKDALIMVQSRVFRILWTLLAVLLVCLPSFYPMLFGSGYYAAAIVMCIFWAICIVRIIRDTRLIQNGNFEIRRDVLIRKEQSTDSDGDPVYTLYYKGVKGQWSKSVSYKKYLIAEEGCAIYAVYLGSSNNPLFHYDEDGCAVK